jgi:hypothetical protein
LVVVVIVVSHQPTLHGIWLVWVSIGGHLGTETHRCGEWLRAYETLLEAAATVMMLLLEVAWRGR